MWEPAPAPTSAEVKIGLMKMDGAIPANADLVAIIEQNCESKSLDYKGPLSWEPKFKDKCCELVKDILAFANTEGGYIVIGVAEHDHGFQLVGVTPEQAGTFESSAMCQFLQNYSEPPINLRVQKVIHAEKLFVILEIPRFSDTPHLCQRDFPGILSDRTLYVRTANNESAPIKSSADFRSIIETAIRNRKDSLLSSFRAILMGTSPEGLGSPKAEEQFQIQLAKARKSFEDRFTFKDKNYSFFIETIFSPEEFDQYRFGANRLESAAHRASISFTGWPFLFIHYNRQDCLKLTDDGLEVVIGCQDFANNDMFDFWRFNESGLFYKKELTPLSGADPAVASGPGIVRHFAEAIYCMTRLYEDLLDDPDAIKLQVIFRGTRHRALIWDNTPYPFRPRTSPYVANRPQLEAIASHSLADWRAGLSDHAIQLAVGVMKEFGFDHPDIEQMKTQVSNLFARRLA